MLGHALAPGRWQTAFEPAFSENLFEMQYFKPRGHSGGNLTVNGWKGQWGFSVCIIALFLKERIMQDV